MYTKNFLLDIKLWFTCGKSNLWKNLVKLQYIMDKIVATKLKQRNSYVRTSQKSSYFDSYILKKHYLHLKKGITTDKETTNILFQHLIKNTLYSNSFCEPFFIPIFFTICVQRSLCFYKKNFQLAYEKVTKMKKWSDCKLLFNFSRLSKISNATTFLFIWMPKSYQKM